MIDVFFLFFFFFDVPFMLIAVDVAATLYFP